MEIFSSYNKKLAGYKDVSETVKVIEKIAASAMHETNRGMDTLQDYIVQLQMLVSRVAELQSLSAKAVPEITQDISTNTLLILVTGDKGLVGDIWKRLFSSVQTHSYTHMLVLGEKGMHFFPEDGKRVQHYSFQQRIPLHDEIFNLAQKLKASFETSQYTTINIAHLKSISLLDQEVQVSQLLPIENVSDDSQKQHNILGYPIISTSLPELQELLSEKYLQSRLRQVILETAISEFSARTVAMEHAGSKTDEESMLLRRRYSKDHRQRETQKQLERFASNHTNV